MKRRTYLAMAGVSITSLTGYAAWTNPDQLPVIGEGVRGKGEPVSVGKSITDDSITYLEETTEVRYVAYYSGDEPQKYRTEPFKQWAKRKCASVGSTVALPAIRDRVAKSIEGVGKSVESRLSETVISVDYAIKHDDEGDVTDRPEMSVSQLVDVTPRTVRATITLDGREYTSGVPVIVQRIEQATADSRL